MHLYFRKHRAAETYKASRQREAVLLNESLCRFLLASRPPPVLLVHPLVTLLLLGAGARLPGRMCLLLSGGRGLCCRRGLEASGSVWNLQLRGVTASGAAGALLPVSTKRKSRISAAHTGGSSRRLHGLSDVTARKLLEGRCVCCARFSRLS